MPTLICVADTPSTNAFPGEAAGWLNALAGSLVPQPVSAPSRRNATAARRAFELFATPLPFPASACTMPRASAGSAEWTARYAGRRIGLCLNPTPLLSPTPLPSPSQRPDQQLRLD